jgi:hypothetical protein
MIAHVFRRQKLRNNALACDRTLRQRCSGVVHTAVEVEGVSTRKQHKRAREHRPRAQVALLRRGDDAAAHSQSTNVGANALGAVCIRAHFVPQLLYVICRECAHKLMSVVSLRLCQTALSVYVRISCRSCSM